MMVVVVVVVVGVVVVVVDGASVVVVVVASVVVVVVVLVAANGELALRPLDRILSPICWAAIDGELKLLVSSARLPSALVRFLVPGLDANPKRKINFKSNCLVSYLDRFTYLRSRVVRVETDGTLASSPSTRVPGVVVVDERKRLGDALAGPIRTASVCSSTTGLTVVVVVGLAGRRANNPANPLVEATLASVETSDWICSLTISVSLIDRTVVVRAAPGRRPPKRLAVLLVSGAAAVSTGKSVCVSSSTS